MKPNDTSPSLDVDRCWQAVVERDHSFDGRFVMAVATTGIYCRPSCPSRRPRRENVEFYTGAEEAERAGYRACRRCRPAEPDRPPENAAAQQEMVEKVRRWIEAANGQPLSLAELGRRAFISPYHLQRTFKRWTGMTPRQYAAACRQDNLMAALRGPGSVTEALYSAGYNSPAGVYRRTDDTLGMTPGAYQRGAPGQSIAYAVVACSLGWLLVAGAERGVCAVMLGDDDQALVRELEREFPAAQLHPDPDGLGDWLSTILAYLAGKRDPLDLPLDVQGTLFQKRVWQALREIPYGEQRSYRQVAETIGEPRAVRAVAAACAANQAALVIPCHRVVRTDGNLGGYRWGLERKQALLSMEQKG